MADEHPDLSGMFTPERWMTAHRSGYDVVVLFDGEDVTARCFAADAALGYVGLYRLDADGKKFVEKPPCGHDEKRANCICSEWHCHVAKEYLRGRVLLQSTPNATALAVASNQGVGEHG